VCEIDFQQVVNAITFTSLVICDTHGIISTRRSDSACSAEPSVILFEQKPLLAVNCTAHDYCSLSPWAGSNSPAAHSIRFPICTLNLFRHPRE
jgi:hypothetical protein